jgi:hypothetical protein
MPSLDETRQEKTPTYKAEIKEKIENQVSTFQRKTEDGVEYRSQGQE